MKIKKPNQSLEQTASLPGKQLFSLGRQAIIQSTQAGLFLSLVESFYETYMRTGSISSKHVCIVTTRRMCQLQTNKNVNLISVAWLVIVTELAYRIYRNCINWMLMGYLFPPYDKVKAKSLFYARSVQLMYIMFKIIGLPKYFSFHLP